MLHAILRAKEATGKRCIELHGPCLVGLTEDIDILSPSGCVRTICHDGCQTFELRRLTIRCVLTIVWTAFCGVVRVCRLHISQEAFRLLR